MKDCLRGSRLPQPILKTLLFCLSAARRRKSPGKSARRVVPKTSVCGKETNAANERDFGFSKGKTSQQKAKEQQDDGKRGRKKKKDKSLLKGNLPEIDFLS